MAGKIQFDLVTPDRLLISEEVDEVIAPGSEGEFGVLPGHCNFLSVLRIGELRYRKGDQWKHLSVSWGFAEVDPKRITVLAEHAERAGEIDMARAEASAKNAEHRLAVGKKEEHEAASRQREKALLRIRVGQKR